MPGTHEGEIVHSSVRASWTVAGMNSPIWGRELADAILTATHQHGQTLVSSKASHTGDLSTKSYPSVPCKCFCTRVNMPESQSRSGPLPQKTSTNSLAHTKSNDDGVLQCFSSSGNRIRPILTRRPEQNSLKFPTHWTRSKHSPW